MSIKVIGRNSLILGDCIEKMKLIPAGSVDLMLTDPPYGATGCKWDIVIPFEPMWAEIWRVLKPNGVCILFGSEPFSSALRMSQIKYFKYDWIWRKNRPTGVATAKFMPMKNHEILSIFYQKKPYFNPIKEPRDLNKASTKRYEYKMAGCTTSSEHNSLDKVEPFLRDKDLRNPTTVKGFKSIPYKQVHPTQKPVDLLEYFIKTYTLEGETVLDFTMGSGSTGVAAGNLQRNFIGIEQDKKYYEIAIKRMTTRKVG